VERDPAERQARVREALQAAVGASDGDGDDAGASSSGGASSSSSNGGGGSGPKWWQERFQALFLPNIRYADGGVGFVQVSRLQRR
jgi:hypothetical protein